MLTGIRSIRRRYATLGGAIAVGVAVAALTAAGGNSTGAPVTVSTVSAATLANGGITLTAPQASSPTVAAGDAAATAASNTYGGREVLEYHFAHCVDSESVPALDEDCWAVSLDPGDLASSPPRGFSGKQFSYLLVLIDPANDKLIEAQSGT
jgi:hypothetical protein